MPIDPAAEASRPSFRYTGRIHVRLTAPGRGSGDRARTARAVETASGLSGGRELFVLAAQNASGRSTRAPVGEVSWWAFDAVSPSERRLRGAEKGVDPQTVWAGVRQALSQPGVDYAEPDVVVSQPSWPDEAKLPPMPAEWHLDRNGALRAWEFLKATGRRPGEGILIGHLDTGYTLHPALPDDRLDHEHETDFWQDQELGSAIDPMIEGAGLQPGHGTGTLCLLAAGHEDDPSKYRGVAPAARVLPIRIAPSVVHVRTESLARGILHATKCGAKVITISMGGLPSRLWADAVNEAYEKGVVICAAAGNHFEKWHTPAGVVYPALFARTIAIAGITQQDGRYRFPDGMSGNDGPRVDLAAPTPNIRWATVQPGKVYGYGQVGGTSSATPQVAGAAAIWLSYHAAELDALGLSGAERVEACRHALLVGATDVGSEPYHPAPGDPSRTRNDFFGDGRLNILNALQIRPVQRPVRPPDDVSWALLKILFPRSERELMRPDELAEEIEALWRLHLQGAEDAARAAARRPSVGGDPLQSVVLDSGVTIDVRPGTPQPISTRSRMTRGADPAGPDPIGAAVMDQDFELLDVVELHAPWVDVSARLSVPLAEDENAVLLVEDGEILHWKLPSNVAGSERRTREESAAARVAVFDFLRASRLDERRVRGVVSDFVTDKARAFVLRFVAKAAARGAVALLESHLRPGLVVVEKGDASQPFRPLAGAALARLATPADREKKLLVFVHGTFSDSTGAFGALRSTAEGQAFLDAVNARYDAVIGFDHATLSKAPDVNAADLLAALRPLISGLRDGATIDFMCHSRGGLVARSLFELAAPSTLGIRPGRIVTVGTPHAGTELANPKQWSSLVDLVTNLVAATARGLSLSSPSAVPVMLAISSGLKTVGALVKYLATAAVNAADVPGLAAMDPGGVFVQRLNETQSGQPGPAEYRFHVITSNFDVNLCSSDGGPFGPRLCAWLVDRAADALMHEANDLVVNVSAMDAIDPHVGGFVADRLDLGRNGTVHHLNYFVQPKVVAALRGWLDVQAAVVESGHDRSFAVVPTTAPVGELFRELRLKNPRYFVLDRGHFVYAVRPDELFSSLALGARERSPRGSIDYSIDIEGALRGTPLELHEHLATPKIHQDQPLPELPLGARPSSTTRVIVVDNQRPLAVIPAPSETRVECSFRSEMDKQIEAGALSPVTVTISRDALNLGAGVGALGTASVDETVKLEVLLIPKKNAEAEGSRFVLVDVPRLGEERLLVFKIRGLAEGRAEVWTVISQGPTPVATLKFEVEVIPAQAAPRSGSLGTIVQDVKVAVPPPSRPFPTLFIDHRTAGGDLFFDFKLDLSSVGGPIRRASDQRIGQVADVKALVVGILRRLEKSWNAPSQLQVMGLDLLEQLVPKAISETLWTHRAALRNVGLRLYTSDPWVPWELVHLADPTGGITERCFLADLGLTRWLYDQDPAAGRFQIRAARYAVPTYPPPNTLTSAPQEIEVLKKLRAQAVSPSRQNVLDVLNAASVIELFHFAGHGDCDGNDRFGVKLLLENNEELIASDINAFAGLHAGRPLVMLNACRVGQAVAGLLGHNGSFADAFVRKGAGAFVGTLWSVEDSTAAVFAKEFYGSLCEQGQTLAEAARAAREAAFNANPNDPTWLAYVVYGHPDAGANLVP